MRLLAFVATSLLLASSVASMDVEFPKSLKTEKAAKKAWGHKCNMLYTFKFGGRAEVLTSTLKEHKKEEPKKDEKKDSGKVKIEPDHGKQKEREKHEAGKTHKRDPKSKKDDKKKKKDVPHTWIATVNCTGSEDITPWVIDFLRDDGWKKVAAK